MFEKEEDKSREVIHLFVANDKSEAEEFYNESTLDFIKYQIIQFTKFKIISNNRESKNFYLIIQEEFLITIKKYRRLKK